MHAQSGWKLSQFSAESLFSYTAQARGVVCAPVHLTNAAASSSGKYDRFLDEFMGAVNHSSHTCTRYEGSSSAFVVSTFVIFNELLTACFRALCARHPRNDQYARVEKLRVHTIKYVVYKVAKISDIIFDGILTIINFIQN